MQFEDYHKLKKHPTPYIYQLLSKGKALFYYGARHSTDPRDPMFADIEKRFAEFHPDVALYEGSTAPVFGSEEEAIREGGEGGWVAFLSGKRDIKAFPLLPSRAAEVDVLSRKFPKEEILLFFVARQLGYRFRVGKEVTEEFLERSYLPSLKRELGWEDFDFSLECLKNIHLRVLGRDLDLTNVESWKDISSPLKGTSVLDTVNREFGDFSDEFATNLIADTLRRYNRVFVIMGDTHAFRQERYLRKIVEG